MNEYQLARNLAVFSVGLGVAELVMPRRVARLIGVSEEHERTFQLLGLRKIASGLGIMQGKPAYFLWSRVAGDIMDLSLLGAALNSDRSERPRVQGAIAAVAAVTIVDLLASFLHTRSHEQPEWRDPRPMESRRGINPGNRASLAASTNGATRHDASAPFN